MHNTWRILILLLLIPSAARAVGFQDVMAPDPGHPAIEIGIWYPSDAPASAQKLDLFTQNVATDGALTPGQHPMIVISHGKGSSLAGHYDTALALAQAGYVVVAPTHTGDNWRDESNTMNILDRPRQISRVIDFMLAGWAGHAGIDPARIGMFGFSAGGFTTLVSIGGHPDFAKAGPYCAKHPGQYTCRLIAEHRGEPLPPVPAGALNDPRIKAAVIAAPAVAFDFMPDGLRDVGVPVQLWRADNDQILPSPDYADAVRTALPTPPDFQTVPDAGHLDFLAPCSDALAHAVSYLCQEAPGFDRIAFHARLNAAMVAFFNRALP